MRNDMLVYVLFCWWWTRFLSWMLLTMKYRVGPPGFAVCLLFVHFSSPQWAHSSVLGPLFYLLDLRRLLHILNTVKDIFLSLLCRGQSVVYLFKPSDDSELQILHSYFNSIKRWMADNFFQCNEENAGVCFYNINSQFSCQFLWIFYQ